jgi:hypothetical protein
VALIDRPMSRVVELLHARQGAEAAQTAAMKRLNLITSELQEG